MGAMRMAALAFSLLVPLGMFAPAAAADCGFRVDGTRALPDGVTIRTLRCLVTELSRVRRENADLKRRLSDVEALLTELPAPFLNIDGVISEVPERAIGTATFQLSARATGGANALPVTQRVLDKVCGAKGGCAVTLAFRQIGLFNDEPKASVLAGPCQFVFEPKDRAWTLGEGCATPARSGVDGDRFASTAAESDPVIVAAGGACIFSESEPDRAIGEANSFQQDEGPGFFLVAMPARQTDGIRRFRCELVLN